MVGALNDAQFLLAGLTRWQYTQEQEPTTFLKKTCCKTGANGSLQPTLANLHQSLR